MVTTIEEVDQGTITPALSGCGPATRWSYAPLQGIPRNAEALWNLVDSVYFSVIPQGHELMECLGGLLNVEAVHASYAKGVEGPCVRLSYTFEGSVDSSKKCQQIPSHIEFLQEENGAVGILYSNTLLPLLNPPTRRLADRALKQKSMTPQSADPSGAQTPAEEPRWKLTDALFDAPMTEDESSNSARLLELAHWEAELSWVQQQRSEVVKSVIQKIEADVRPNRKHWSDCDQNLLAIYEKRPPSSFQPTAASLASTTASANGTNPLPLHLLGKVDSSLPDSFKDAELCCCVCGEGDTTDDNEILICDGCSFAAHQDCYFVKSIPDGQWFCQLCVSFFSKSSKPTKGSRRFAGGEGLEDFINATSCALCLQSAAHEGGGLMKPTNTGAWAHVKCAMWVPEAAFPADGLSIKVIPNKEREELRCSICKCKGGNPLQCAFGKCVSAFHVSCAARVGLLPEEKTLQNLYCSRHMKIQLKTSPCTSRLLSVRKQDFFLKAVGDKLIAPKIGGSLVTPTYDPFVDSEQAFLLQLAGVHPLIVKELELSGDAAGGFIGPNDLMEESVPLIKEICDVQPIGEQAKDTFIELSCCCECMRPISESDDLCVKCEQCGVFAHALCYDRAGAATPNVDDLSDKALWKLLKYDPFNKFGRRSSGCSCITCVRCEMVNASSVLAKPIGDSVGPIPLIRMVNTHCVLCMQLGGVMLPVQQEADDDDDSTSPSTNGFFPPAFAHPRCLWWILATSMVSLTSMPPMQIKSIPSNYHFHPCSVCGSRLGCTVRCARVGCERRFHISCGFHAGAFFTCRSNNMVIAGSRDSETIDEVLEALSGPIHGSSSMRRVITCWSHEQRGARRAPSQLGRLKPSRCEIVRWVPEGIRSELIGVVNQVLMGGVADVTGLTDSVKSKTAVSAPKRRYRRKSEKEEGSDWSDNEGRKKKRQKKTGPIVTGESPLIGQGRVQTVRFVDGEEVTCEDEDWDGGCSMCGKAWTDARGQMLESICCDKCDQWYHFDCVGIEQAPSGDFVCPNCRVAL